MEQFRESQRRGTVRFDTGRVSPRPDLLGEDDTEAASAAVRKDLRALANRIRQHETQSGDH